MYAFWLDICLEVEFLGHRSCITLYISTSRIWVPFAPPICQYFILSVIFILFKLADAYWYYNAIFICFTFITTKFDHFFKCLLAIWISSLVKYLFESLVHSLGSCLSCWFVGILSHSRYMAFVNYICYNYALPFCGSPLHLFQDVRKFLF